MYLHFVLIFLCLYTIYISALAAGRMRDDNTVGIQPLWSGWLRASHSAAEIMIYDRNYVSQGRQTALI